MHITPFNGVREGLRTGRTLWLDIWHTPNPADAMLTAAAHILISTTFFLPNPCTVEGHAHEWPEMLPEVVDTSPDPAWADCEAISVPPTDLLIRLGVAGQEGIVSGFGLYGSFKVELYDIFRHAIVHSRAGRWKAAVSLLRPLLSGLAVLATDAPDSIDRIWGLDLLEHASLSLHKVEVRLGLESAAAPGS